MCLHLISKKQYTAEKAITVYKTLYIGGGTLDSSIKSYNWKFGLNKAIKPIHQRTPENQAEQSGTISGGIFHVFTKCPKLDIYDTYKVIGVMQIPKGAKYWKGKHGQLGCSTLILKELINPHPLSLIRIQTITKKYNLIWK